MKDASIPHLRRILDVAVRGWQEVDHWEADLFATGFVNRDRTRLAYVSTWNTRPGRYHVQLEELLRTGMPTMTPPLIIDDCDETAMMELLQEHLGE